MQQSRSAEVRTKVANLRKEVDDRFFDLLEQLRSRAISSAEYQRLMREVCTRSDLSASLQGAMARVDQSNKAEWLVRRHVGRCRYTVQVYKLQPEASQAPHQHHNLISTHLVLRGRVHLREYQRLRKDGTDTLLLEPLRDEVLETGDVFQASEWANNVHWFGAVDGPALMFSIDARGYETTTFHNDNDGVEHFGRLYLDPTSFDSDGNSIGVRLPEAAAKSRFEGKPVAAFPMPDFHTNDQFELFKTG